MEQPKPKVTVQDVKRIALRDFGEEQLSQVIYVLENYGEEDYHVDKPRVRLAILKLANGDLDRLLETTVTAIKDFRDVVAWAEYPEYLKKSWSADTGFNKREQKVAIKADWKQYQAWLNQK